jgi:SAM-dependent methyltransferase
LGPETAPTGPNEAIRGAPLVHCLAADVVLRHAAGARVLDVGGAVPLVVKLTTDRAASVESTALPDDGGRLPHNDAAFDMAVCLRSLPFLDPDSARSEARAAAIVSELARVVAPGGVVLIDIDNPQSLRGAFFGVRYAMKALEAGPLVVDTQDGPNRFDTLGRFVGHLPQSLELIRVHGLQVLAAHHELHRAPLLGGLLARAEWWVRDLGLTRRFGAHLLLVLRKLSGPVAGQ